MNNYTQQKESEKMLNELAKAYSRIDFLERKIKDCLRLNKIQSTKLKKLHRILTK